ncbi:SusC/RagA family TonB-linked outer membrane protein [Cellulophaga baltica]|uniref:SusC/RagA family TonB-linked outer membrane protein n=1 Tax=Cellulophaga baltica TaxID=76594 RepID=UPI0024949DCF|nr:SusC/RagA family TonB-linked outer membrane protein [Cellulophaga baltica]
MKTKGNGILTLLLAFVVHLTFAQEKTISGTVTDQDGLPLPGVNIVVIGTTNGTQTDFDGLYTIKGSPGQNLLFTYVGQKDSQKLIGSSSIINIQMTEDAQALQEVVVTALGIKSKPRELSYSVQTVEAGQIENSNEVNIASALSSKAAGVQVTASSGSVGASANIRVRGSTSINRNNSPLFVIDGVPIDNSSSGNGTGGTDNSNRGIDINQNDIASISILKGVAAQTLYGLRAANGVILITTKSGKSGKPKVVVTSNVAFTRASNFPELQNEYAQGRAVEGVRTWRGPDTFEGFSWGPAISSLEFDGDSSYPYDSNGRLVPTGTGNGNPAKAYDNLSFFKTGILSDLNVSISGGTESVKYFVSGGKMDQTGISPTEKFGRKSFRANISADLSEKLTLSASGTYVNSGGRRVQRGSNISGIMLGLLRTTPTFDNGNGLTAGEAASTESTYVAPDGSQRSYRAGIYDNPYWTVAKNPSFDDVNRFIGNLQFEYTATDWLTFRGTYGYDRFTDSRLQGIDIGSATDSNGQVITRDESNEDISTQLLAIVNKDFSEKTSFGATVGVDQYRKRNNIRRTDGFGLTIPGFFHVSNSASQTNLELFDQKELKAFLSQVTFGYDNMLFANASFRNDWSSTLPADNNSFQSYSIGTSFVFSELLNDSQWFNYGKLRGSYGKTGNDADTFATNTYYQAGSVGGDGFIDPNVFPLFSSVAFERSSLLGNSELRPEETTEWEVGAEFKFFQSRLTLDVTYYDKETKDQIIQVSQPATTGYTNRTINAGVISNNGWEISSTINPIRSENFNWDLNVNFTKYENVVESLVDGIEPILLNGFTSTSSRAVPGESYGAIFGSRWLRDENGNQLVDDDGLAIADPTSGVIGDPIPDFTLGLRNTFSYKNLSLTALIDYREGGDVWCGTCGILDYFGVSKTTGELRNGSYVVDGIRQSDGQPNTTAVAYADPAGGLGANRWVRYGFGGVAEDYVYDGSFIKLREVALTYSLPTELISKIGLDSFSLTAAGRNLWVQTDYPGIDPETNLTGDSNGIGLDYFNQPQTQSYSLAIRVSF